MAVIKGALISRKGALSMYDGRGDEHLTPEELADKKKQFEELREREKAEGKYNPKFIDADLVKASVKFPKDRVYHFSLDPSSKCMGLYVTDKENSFHFIADVFRGADDKFRFYEYLRGFLHRMFEGCKIEMNVVENLPPVKFKNAGNVLKEMRGVLQSWFVTDSVLSTIPDEGKMRQIYPQSWKSEIVDKKKGPNRRNDKREVALDIVDRFPELEPYFSRCNNAEYDSFDACGIYHGYRLKHFNDDGMGVIAGAKSYYGEVAVFFNLFSAEDMQSRKKIISYFVAESDNIGMKVLAWNKEQSPVDNYVIAAAETPFTLTIVDDLLSNIAIRLQFGMPMDNRTLVAYIIRRNLISAANMKHLRKLLPCEEVNTNT